MNHRGLEHGAWRGSTVDVTRRPMNATVGKEIDVRVVLDYGMFMFIAMLEKTTKNCPP